MIRYVDAYRAQSGVQATRHTVRATECGFITARGRRVKRATWGGFASTAFVTDVVSCRIVG